MNRADLSKAVLLYDQLAAAAKAKSAVFREQLDIEARAEYEAQGMAPTWRLPDVGTVTLPISQAQVYVNDAAALVEWVAARTPEQIEVQRVVRPSYLMRLLQSARAAEDVACDEHGEIIPGLGVRRAGTPQSLSIRPTTDAKAVARMHADGLLEQFEETLLGSVRPEVAP